MPIRIDIHHHIHIEHGSVFDAFERIERAIANLGVRMSAQLDALKAEVERNTSVDQSAIALIQGLATKIEALKDDPVALQSLADDLRAKNDALAAAVAANTPAEPTP